VIIDTSALIAILRDEPEATACAKAIEAASDRRISAANFVEAAIVIDGSRYPVVSRHFDNLVNEARLDCHRDSYLQKVRTPILRDSACLARSHRDHFRVSYSLSANIHTQVLGDGEDRRGHHRSTVPCGALVRLRCRREREQGVLPACTVLWLPLSGSALEEIDSRLVTAPFRHSRCNSGYRREAPV